MTGPRDWYQVSAEGSDGEPRWTLEPTDDWVVLAVARTGLELALSAAEALALARELQILARRIIDAIDAEVDP